MRGSPRNLARRLASRETCGGTQINKARALYSSLAPDAAVSGGAVHVHSFGCGIWKAVSPFDLWMYWTEMHSLLRPPVAGMLCCDTTISAIVHADTGGRARHPHLPLQSMWMLSGVFLRVANASCQLSEVANSGGHKC
jgi:hypothetical protein